MKPFALFVFVLLFLAFSTSYITKAQLGEVAGQPSFNVSLGGSESQTITIINEGSVPLPFRVVLPSLNTIANTTTPAVTAFPMSGSIAPNSEFEINVTVHMPSNSKNLGHTWTGVMQIIENSTISTSGASGEGAVIVEGVAKIITITASQPKFNILEIIVPAIIVVAAVGAGVALYYRNKSKKALASRKTKRAAVAKAVKVRKGRKTTRKKTRAKARKGARTRRKRR
ncbi:MAG: hypothetical protein ACP5UC_00435 [Candidatus Micrarchaeia archaeon]